MVRVSVGPDPFGDPRPVVWVGSSRQDLRDMPDPVRDAIGKALFYAQIGRKSPRAKPFHGCGGGASVLEVVEDHDGDTYRAVYTVRFAEAVYVLHVFQKKRRAASQHLSTTWNSYAAA